MKRLFLILLLTATLTPVTMSAETTKPCSGTFMITTSVGRVHAAQWCDERSAICGQEGKEVKQNCQFRGEDGGDPFSSCECQGVRHYRDCMYNWGCTRYSEYFRIYEDYPHCFIS